MAPKVPAAKKGEKRAGKAKSGAVDGSGKKTEARKEKGKLCDLHLQGLETGSP